MLHAEVSGCAKGERGNRGVGAEKALIVAVVGYAVCAVGIIINEAEIAKWSNSQKVSFGAILEW